MRRHRLAVFSVPFALVLGFEYLRHARDSWPDSCIVLIPEPWSGLLTSITLAGGATWLWLRLPRNRKALRRSDEG